MLIASFPAGPWQTNCYVLGTAEDADCLIIDPGLDAAEPVRSTVAKHRLRPVAVMATHGHLDHTYAISGLCQSFDIGCWIAFPDVELLTDPFAAMPPGTDTMLASAGYRTDFAAPDRVETFTGGDQLELAGLTFTTVAAPGHTPGSTLLRLCLDEDSRAAGVEELIFSGDVIFAGSVGRTDLPLGNQQQMQATLRTIVPSLPDAALLLPGHGPHTTMATERATNPYLGETALAGPLQEDET